MSGKPNPEGIKNTVAQLNRIEKLTREAEDLEQRVNMDTRRLGSLKESLSIAWGEYKKLMDEMDLTMEGNTGFEKRAAWFFVEMKKQLAEQIKNGDIK